MNYYSLENKDARYNCYNPYISCRQLVGSTFLAVTAILCAHVPAVQFYAPL